MLLFKRTCEKPFLLTFHVPSAVLEKHWARRGISLPAREQASQPASQPQAVELGGVGWGGGVVWVTRNSRVQPVSFSPESRPLHVAPRNHTGAIGNRQADRHIIAATCKHPRTVSIPDGGCISTTTPVSVNNSHQEEPCVMGGCRGGGVGGWVMGY